MKEHDVVFSISLSEGFANIEWDEKGEPYVQFLNDEGYAGEGVSPHLKDVQKIANFMKAMYEMKINQYQSKPKA